jgi:16S rRNA U516 pseudouridylate synthase RsuA-like enzyme
MQRENVSRRTHSIQNTFYTKVAQDMTKDTNSPERNGQRAKQNKPKQNKRMKLPIQPGTKLPKTYLAVCAGPLGDDAVDSLRAGVELSGLLIL